MKSPSLPPGDIPVGLPDEMPEEAFPAISETKDTERSFGLAPTVRWRVTIGLAIPLAIALPLLVLGVVTGSIGLVVAGLLIGLVLLPLILSLVSQLRNWRLTVHSRGIRIRGVLGKEEVSIAWDAIDRLQFEGAEHGIVLQRPLEQPMLEQMAKAIRPIAKIEKPTKEMTESRLALVQQMRWIPIESFTGWLIDGDLSETIGRFAPRLSGDIEPALASLTRREQKQRWLGRGLTGLMVMVFLVGCGILFVSTVVPPANEQASLRASSGTPRRWPRVCLFSRSCHAWPILLASTPSALIERCVRGIKAMQ